MKLIVKTGSTNEHSEGLEFAIVDLSPEAAAKILERKKMLDTLHAADRDLEELVYWGWVGDVAFLDECAIHSQPGVSEDFDFYELMEDKSFVEAPAWDYNAFSFARTECDRLVIDRHGVTFRCYPKHCDWMVTTHEIDYATVESALMEVSA